MGQPIETKPSASVHITQVANGYLVSAETALQHSTRLEFGVMGKASDVYVFPTMKDLQDWLAQYFETK